MRRSTRKSSIGIGIGVEERPNSNPSGSFSTRFSLSSFIKRVEKLTDDQRNAIKKAGFGNLLLIPNQMLSKNLLVELMDRWSPVEQGFRLFPGVIKITLMDVALILGIRMIGDTILLKEDEAFSDLESDYGAALWKRKITVASLETRLDSLGEVVNEDFVRTFILFMFGTLLFPNASGKVDSRYLSCLKNLDHIGQFAWGAAVLEDIFMWLNKRKESNVQYVGGCLILLQIWSYEHIDIARPGLVDSYLMFPRARRWENSKSHQRQWFSAKFRELQDHQIKFQLQPTSEELQFDVINELLEVESSSIDNSSDGESVIGEQKGLEVHLRHSTSSQHIPLQTEPVDFPSTSCPSELHQESVELSSQSQNSEKLTSGNVYVGGLHPKSDMPNMKKEHEQNGLPEAKLKQSTTSQDIAEAKTETMACSMRVSEVKKEPTELSSISHDSEKLASSSRNEDELIKRNQILEAQNMELRKEIEALKAENTQLKMHLCSSNDLVSRLEGLVLMDHETYTYSS